MRRIRLRDFILALALIVSPALASAQTVTPTGTHDATTGFYYLINSDGKAVINGYDGSTASFNGATGTLTFPSTLGGVNVEGINSGAYSFDPSTLSGGVTTTYATNGITGMASIKAIVLPVTIQYIGYAAFYGCTQLASTNISPTNTPNLSTIGRAAFEGCTALNTTSSFPMLTTTTTVGAAAFEGSGIYGLTLLAGNGLANITQTGAYAFANCSNMHGSLLSLSGLTSIGEGTWQFPGTLLNSDLPLGSTTSIGAYAFAGFRGTGLLTPNLSGTFGDYAFYNASNLTSVSWSFTSATSFGQGAFYATPGMSGVLNLSAVTNIGQAAFAKHTGKSSVAEWIGIPNSTTLPDRVFDNCAYFAFCNGTPPGTDVSILDLTHYTGGIGQGAFFNDKRTLYHQDYRDYTTNTNVIGSWAFANNDLLRSVDNSANISTVNLGDSIFVGCPELEYINFSNNSINMAVNAGVSPAHTGLSRVTTTTYSPFNGTSAHTLIYLPSGQTGIPAVSATDGENYIAGSNSGSNAGTCAWLYAQDGCEYYMPYGFTTTKASWNNSTKRQDINANNALGTTVNGSELIPNPDRNDFGGPTDAATAYLPFPFTLPADINGYTLTYKNNHNPSSTTDNTFVFTQQVASYPYAAYTPYVLKATSAVASFTPIAGTITIAPTLSSNVSRIVGLDYYPYTTKYTDPAKTAVTNVNCTQKVVDPTSPDYNPGNQPANPDIYWGFYGTTEKINYALATTGPANVTTNNWKAYTLWPVSAGFIVDTWIPLGSLDTINPFRCFIAGFANAGYTVPATAKPSISFVDLNGNTTGIDNIGGTSNEPANIVQTRIYTIGGQYMGNDINALPKGIYIVNGKKVVK